MSNDEPPKQKLLFLCNQNRLRSPTAEAVFRENLTLEVKSASVDKDASIPVSRELLE